MTSTVSEPTPAVDPVAWPSAGAGSGFDADSPTARGRRSAGIVGSSRSPTRGFIARVGSAGSAALGASRARGSGSGSTERDGGLGSVRVGS